MIPDLVQLKHRMRFLRNKFGALTPIGHAASNVEGAIENLQHPSATGHVGELQRANIERSIKRQLEGIARLMTA